MNTVYAIKCRCAVHPERQWSFLVADELTIGEARKWLVKKIGVYADLSFVHVEAVTVEKVK